MLKCLFTFLQSINYLLPDLLEDEPLDEEPEDLRELPDDLFTLPDDFLVEDLEELELLFVLELLLTDRL